MDKRGQIAGGTSEVDALWWLIIFGGIATFIYGIYKLIVIFG